MKRVLVVEDEPGIALVLEDSLRLEGHEVEVIANGLAASERACDGTFDLILLDGMLARERRIRSMPRFETFRSENAGDLS